MKILNFIFIFILLTVSAYSQDTETLEMLSIADVLDNASTEEFYKIPEIKSKDGALEVHLFINKDTFNFAGDIVKLRNYSYETGGKYSKIPGPFGPTLRINPSDRLTMILHNNLSTGSDMNYLGSIPNIPRNVTLFNTELKNPDLLISNRLKNILLAGAFTGKDSLIVTGNLPGATGEIVKVNEEWTIYGKEPCKCPAGEEGTCGYIEIIYTIKKMFNPGIGKNALRIYEMREHSEEDHNIPHGFNTTNMHTHGFHISPFQDDILRMVDPGFFSYYTYDLDKHTPGTMWYHPHIHGSTALQVASGMSGVIIIEDGDLSGYPALAEASKSEHEKVLLFNQIIYDTEIQELPDFNTLLRSKAPKGTTINGKVVPRMPIRPGEVQRWRMIHSGYSSLLGISFPDEIEVYQIAVDGIMFDEPRRLYSLHMAPGNRSDILIRVPNTPAGGSKTIDISSMKYDLNCEYFPTDKACIHKKNRNTESLMKLIVSGQPMNMEFPQTLPGPGDEHANITNAELSNLGSPRTTDFERKGRGKNLEFLINGKAFEANIIHETLTLGDAEVWKLSSSKGNHPYHIHINPFLVTHLIDKKTGVSRPLKTRIWKDVALTSDKYTTMMRTRYQKYWGDFVLHCHVLYHEDMGMMQRIRIQKPVPKK